MAPGRKTGGRIAGVPNKATADVKALAQKYTGQALEVLQTIAADDKAPAAARVSASVALLDRGHGRPAQAITGEGGGPIAVTTTVQHIHESSADD